MPLGRSTYATLQRSSPTRGKNFGSSNLSLLPPLLVAPGPHPRRPSRERSNENSYNSSTRPSREAVAANQVFHLEEDLIADQSGLSLATSTLNDSQMALSDVTSAVQPDVPLGRRRQHDSV